MGSEVAGRGRALPRVALVGNPSDLHGGCVVARTFDAFAAEVELREADAFAVEPDEPGARALIEAACRAFEATPPLQVRWRTTIPREIGLAGSSALVIATLRALLDRAAATLAPSELAALALRVEVDDLGIAAGPQDRLVQAYEGLIAMEFGAGDTGREGPSAAGGGAHGTGSAVLGRAALDAGEACRSARVQRLDPASAGPLVVAFRRDAAHPSGAVHGRAPDPEVVDAMRACAGHAREAVAALGRGDRHALGALMERNVAERRAALGIDRPTEELLGVAARLGLPANQCGSGGAIVALADGCSELARAFASVGGEVAGIAITG